NTYRIDILYFNDTSPPQIYTLSLHDALPISSDERTFKALRSPAPRSEPRTACRRGPLGWDAWTTRAAADCSSPGVILRRGGYRRDRKSTRLNSSHVAISYAVFCLKKKNNNEI